MREIKDRIDDALAATRAAVKEGIVAGGGCALLHAQTDLDELTLQVSAGDEALGVQIIRKALEAPLRCISFNAGYESSITIEKVRQGSNSFGFDAKNNVYGNMIQLGIIDPVKVTRCALQNAASIAGLLLTTEAIICSEPEEKKSSKEKSPMGPMPAMI
jgi:chaperonin GroEL